MRGAKPKLQNVIPMRPDGSPDDEKIRRRAVAAKVRKLQPRGLDDDLKKEWKRVATLLAHPTVDRLKPIFVDVIYNYCVACIRLRKFRELMPTLNREIYNAAAVVTQEGETQQKPGRNGVQIRSSPHVAQMNEAWRQWRSLMAELGMSPTAERNMMPGQGDMFDEQDKYFH